MRKHKDFPITFSSWYQCNRLDEISSGIEDLVGYGETISQGEEFNICKALGYEILTGSNVSEGEAYRAGKRELENRRRIKAEKERAWKLRSLELKEKAKKEKKEEDKKGCLGGLFTLFVGLPALLAAVAGLAWLMRTIFFAACDAVNGLYSLICSNIFLVVLFLIPSTIIFVGHKIESKKKQNKDIK